MGHKLAACLGLIKIKLFSKIDFRETIGTDLNYPHAVDLITKYRVHMDTVLFENLGYLKLEEVYFRAKKVYWHIFFFLG